MHRPFMWNSGKGKGWDSCGNPVNALRTTGHGLQDEFLSRNLTSHSPYTGEPCWAAQSHNLEQKGLTAIDDLAPMDLESEG